MDYERLNNLLQKTPPKKNYPKQLQTDKAFNNNMENPNCTDKRRNV